jgi:hypothetical protein
VLPPKFAVPGRARVGIAAAISKAWNMKPLTNQPLPWRVPTINGLVFAGHGTRKRAQLAGGRPDIAAGVEDGTEAQLLILLCARS